MVIDVGLQELPKEESVQDSLRLLGYCWYSAEYYEVLVTWSFHYA